MLRHMVATGRPARGQRGGLRTEIAAWDAGKPAAKILRAGALASRSPRFGSEEPAKRTSRRTTSGRKDRESDAARDHSKHTVLLGCHSGARRRREPDPEGPRRKPTRKRHACHPVVGSGLGPGACPRRPDPLGQPRHDSATPTRSTRFVDALLLFLLLICKNGVYARMRRKGGRDQHHVHPVFAA